MRPASILLASLITLLLPASALAGEEVSRLHWGDLDGDGLTDVLAIAPDGRAALFVNRGDGSFQDHSAVSGIDLGGGLRAALWGDADGDRDLDLLILAREGPGRLWRNLGQGTFIDATAGSGLELSDAVGSLEWRDYDRDGRPDLVAGTLQGELLFHNTGAGRFERVELLTGASETAVAFVGTGSIEEPPVPERAGSGSAGSSKAAGGFSALPANPPSGGSASASPWCPPSIEDSALPGNCIPASTLPMLGALLPLGPELFVGPGGSVGIGTTSPGARLDVAGRIQGAADIIAAGQLRSQATAVAPLEVASSLRVPNLNADLLDGLHASVFSQLGASIEGSEVTDGTLTAADLAADSVGSSEIAAGAVGAGELANGAVSGIKILDGSVGSADLSLGAVNGSAIADGAITNADVSASAAIAGSKIQPYFTAPVGIGTSAPGKALDVVGDVRASGLISGQASWSSNPNANSTVTAINTGTGSAGYLEVKNSSSNAEALRVLNSGLGRTAFLSTTNVSSTRPVIEAGTFGNGEVLYGVTYGKAAAAYLEVQNSTSTAPGALYVTTNGVGDGIQVHHSRNGTEGVYVNHTGNSGWGILSQAGGPYGVGVRGESNNALGFGVWGYSANIGVVGTTTNPASVAIYSDGDFSAAGSKNFVQPHPTDGSKEVVFTCLEGNESGTYFRGTAELSAGRAVIEVPEEFRLVTEAEGLSVQLTPVGARAILWVERQDLDEVVVRGDTDVSLHYQVNGVRRGFPATERIRDARAFVPELRGVPFGTQYPDDLRRILVANGTLTPDFTPNEATAAARGWTLRDPSERDLPMLEAIGLASRTAGVPQATAAQARTTEQGAEPLQAPDASPHPSALGERVPMPQPSSGGGS